MEWTANAVLKKNYKKKKMDDLRIDLRNKIHFNLKI